MRKIELIKKALRAHIREAELASKGPWEHFGGSRTHAIRTVGSMWDRVVGCDIDIFPDQKDMRPSPARGGGVWDYSDVKFIVKARTMSPAACQGLLTAIEALEALSQLGGGRSQGNCDAQYALKKIADDFPDIPD